MAWQPSVSNYYQSLYINLRKSKKITKIGTMGYDGSYVTEYNVQYSDDGENWMSAFGGGGFANTDGASSYTDPVSGEVKTIAPSWGHFLTFSFGAFSF